MSCGTTSKKACQKDAGAVRQPVYRIDMDDMAGEVMLLRYQARDSGTSSTAAADADTTMSNGHGCSHAMQPGRISSKQKLQAIAEGMGAASCWAPFAEPVSFEQLIQAEDSAFMYKQTSHEGKATQDADSPDIDPEPAVSLHMSVYNVAEQRLVCKQEFVDSHRLVSLQNNPYVPLPADPSKDSGPPRRWKHQVYALPYT